MRRVSRRDQAAFEALHAQYERLVRRMAQRILNNDEQAAEEVVQDVFFQIWRWPEKWDPARGTFVSWLLTVTRHTAIDHQRRLKRQQTLSVETIEHIGSNHNDDEPHSDDQRVLKALLRRLPQEQRQVVVLAFLRGMTHDEIARHLGIPVGTAKSRLRLGLQKLRKAWPGQKKDHE